jgi:tetrahydromethanopterin S-methyltransferase subunit G
LLLFMTQFKATKFACIALVSSLLNGCFSTPELAAPAEDTRSAVQILAQKRQDLAFGQVVYSYFQGAPDQTLLQGALTRLNELRAQTPYGPDNQDRLDLMKGAVSLQLGMTQQAEGIFNRLLAQSGDPYIQANTWFWLAKSSFAQKRMGVSERAYSAMIEHDLEDELSQDHWEELVYQVSHERMSMGADWETLAGKLNSDSIYQTYLIANQAVIQHNKQDYDAANEAFISAKLLLNATPVENSIQGENNSSSWWSWFNWFGNGLTEIQEDRAFQERNALFDRLNYGLGVTLLEQKDYANALIALKLIGRESLHAEQAMLTYGWTLAQENRWPLAMAAWQYLRDNSQGIYALQASHGLAYGYEQQGALAEAFHALRDSSRQLDAAMTSLSTFGEQVQQAAFFDTVANGNWPLEHRDLQILLLSGNGDIDSAYLLGVRGQAKQLLNTLDGNLAQIDGMYRLLDEREHAFERRSEALSLTDAQEILDRTQLRIEAVETTLNSDQISAKLLATNEQVLALERLDKGEERIQRINSERESNLSQKYGQRVARLKGVLAWELSEAYPATRWQHQKQLNQLKVAYADANNQYTQLKQLQNNTSSIDEQRSRVDVMALSAAADYTRTEALVDSLTQRLTEFLQANMNLRMQALADQQVATRLAIIRLQDLAKPGRGL